MKLSSYLSNDEGMEYRALYWESTPSVPRAPHQKGEKRALCVWQLGFPNLSHLDESHDTSSHVQFELNGLTLCWA